MLSYFHWMLFRHIALTSIEVVSLCSWLVSTLILWSDEYLMALYQLIHKLKLYINYFTWYKKPLRTLFGPTDIETLALEKFWYLCYHVKSKMHKMFAYIFRLYITIFKPGKWDIRGTALEEDTPMWCWRSRTIPNIDILDEYFYIIYFICMKCWYFKYIHWHFLTWNMTHPGNIWRSNDIRPSTVAVVT